ncbi:aromatic ring-hydroxylating dioxygenase subunit alpha [Sphingomonas glacialis]|uniref:Aromatic ring-hydroxylating dioxygenase subunit alpha n=1 Tax=Sphingomonas glacialis TaxID=658225 RepID=A0A502FFN0_9SPHN|nr:aromatic ring-hydroxylating dioxygenase subunit alpha [Sphingomonas glacialis]TPG48218.1 aromatic ring-hydroxylating dioxygenase subunit alpha [Sphingomonas glacialis]
MNTLTSIKAAPSPLELGRFADEATPLIRNCWYVAGFADEISRDIISRRLLGIDIALYRTLAGEAVAVRNRCPHRSFPLAKGKLDGDTLVCGYHGMQFDPSGRCVNMPSMPLVPTNANVRSFPLAERGPIVWIWMGEADHADEALVPETPWLADPAWKSVRGQYHIKTDYVTMHENLLDQTHFPFLHPGTVGTPEYARSKLDVRRDGDVIVIDRALRDAAPPGIYGVPMQLMDKKVDRFSEARFVSPALHTAYASVVDRADASGEPKTYRFNITHLLTPETNGTIHYWWFNTRDERLDDAEADAFLLAASEAAYLEDVDALEWISEVITSDIEPQFDLNFAADKPGLLMRRALFELAEAETSPALTAKD